LWADFMRAAGAGDRVFDLMDRRPGMPLDTGLRPVSCGGRVTFQGVGFSYPTRPELAVLDGLNLTIERGEVVALVGPSGGGKSTIASLVPRLYDPTSGRVCL